MADASLRIERRSGPHGAVVYAEGRPLTGPNPASSMKRRLPDPNTVSPQTLFLVCSPLDGFGLEQWISRIPSSCGVLLVELDPQLGQLQPRNATWHHHRHLDVAISWDTAIHDAERLIHRSALRRIRTIHLSGGSRLHRERYLKLEERLNHSIEQFWHNRGTQIRLQRRWIANLMRNVARPGRSVIDLRSSVGNRAVLVGAGPSLDTQIPLLSRLFPSTKRDTANHYRGILIAIDTALPVLAAANIQPDFVITMDGQLANAQDFLPWQWDRTALIADATTHFSIPRRFAPCRRYWFVSRFADVQLFSDPELSNLFDGMTVIPAFGSVAPAAIHILSEILGIADILLLGIDFWYRPPQSHARMSTMDRWLKKSTCRIGHRDGHDRALARPMRQVRLRDGSQTWGDSVLSDQALVAREIIRRASARVIQVPAEGLDVGAETVSPGQILDWWSSNGVRIPGTISGTDSHDAKRRSALHGLLHRLRSLEKRLQKTDANTMIDGGLDFVLVDLPQWPLMTLSPEWMELHRLRVLRSVRDYRRRVETLLLRSSPQD